MKQVIGWRQRIWDSRRSAKNGKFLELLDLPDTIYFRFRNSGVDTIEELMCWSYWNFLNRFSKKDIVVIKKILENKGYVTYHLEADRASRKKAMMEKMAIARQSDEYYYSWLSANAIDFKDIIKNFHPSSIELLQKL